MPKILLNFVFILLMTVVHRSGAQNASPLLEMAEKSMEAKDYYGALVLHKRALQIDSTNAEVVYRAAQNFMAVNHPKAASHYYYKAYLMGAADQYPLLPYYMAEAYRSSGEYRKAKRHYSKALQPYRKERNGYWYKRINQSKAAAKWADRKSKKGPKAENMGANVNGSSAEYSARLQDGVLYFSALIADSVKENQQIEDKEYLSRIYRKEDKTSAEIQPLELDENSAKTLKGMHLANPFLFQNELYFSACDTQLLCSIYRSELIDNVITKTTQLNNNINFPNSNNTQAHLVQIDSTPHLFFSSDRPGGMGGMDLWVAKEASFGFDEPLNLGPIINSPDDEITPYYSAKSKRLYFSSNWHSGFGGFDVFQSEHRNHAYETPKNMGYGINSPADDYYFSLADQKALFTSNRSEGNVAKGASCCNDLFAVDFEEEIMEDTLDQEEKEVNVVVLNKYLPLQLYFHNDEPNPNSRDSSTKANYMTLSEGYVNLQSEYIKEYGSLFSGKKEAEAQEAINAFFEEMQEGLAELEEFTPLLLQELEKGSQIELEVKGFASALSAADYNLTLTKRRINSIENYFEEALEGAFVPYLKGDAKNGGLLSIKAVPYGDLAVQERIDDNNKIAAIYSPAAARQRRIELIAVTNSFDDSQINLEKLGEVSFAKTSYDLGEVTQGILIERFFEMSNTGEGSLSIYNISSNCACATLEYEESLEAGKSQKLWTSIETQDLKGAQSIRYTVVTDCQDNIHELELKFTVIEP